MEETNNSSGSKGVQERSEEGEEKEACCERPLHEYVAASRLVKNRALYRTLLVLRGALLLLFIAYRVSTCMGRNEGDEAEGVAVGVAALVCEVCFCINFLLSISYKWFLVERVAYPDRLLSSCMELPSVDVFVTTADPIKEPPLITINTVLSALTLEYPTHKLAFYVSDDGGSLLTLWALKEAASFAKSWVPFCKKFSPYISPRAPSPYFSQKTSAKNAKLYGFYREWCVIKEEYYALENQISFMSEAYCNSDKETLVLLLNKLMETTTLEDRETTYSSWARNYNPRNHSSYCEILLDKPICNTNMDLPFLVYMSREKRPNKKHHFKAGAMNALLRVSGVMTNAPYVLNLDCDMYVNGAKALLQAMCFFMQPRKIQDENDIGFVQFPQCFEGANEDDTYGGQMVAALELFMKGTDGVQGPPYCGTGCIHKRESLYGKTIHQDSSKPLLHGTKLEDMFGRCQLLTFNAQSTLSMKLNHHVWTQDSFSMEPIAVMDCTYEDNTSWGKEVGLMYGSLTEDIMTGTKIHSRGWRSIAYSPFPLAFIGRVPSTSQDALIMRKRWSTGLLEILFTPCSPLLVNITKGLTLIQRFIYIYLYTWTLFSLPICIYALLPCLSIAKREQIYPKIVDPSLVLPLSLSISIYMTGFYENRVLGVGVKQWWNTEQMESIVAISSSLFAIYEVMKNKVMGLEQTTFQVTPKDQKSHMHGTNQHGDDEGGQDQEGFVVNSTLPIFMAPTIVVLLNITNLVVYCVHTLKHLTMRKSSPSLSWSLSTEVACSMWVLFVLKPFSKGVMLWVLGHRGPLALSSSTILHSTLIAIIMVSLTYYFL